MPQHQVLHGEIGDLSFYQVEDFYNGMVICTLLATKMTGEQLSATWRVPMSQYALLVQRQHLEQLNWRQVIQALIDIAWSYGEVEPPSFPHYVHQFRSAGSSTNWNTTGTH